MALYLQKARTPPNTHYRSLLDPTCCCIHLFYPNGISTRHTNGKLPLSVEPQKLGNQREPSLHPILYRIHETLLHLVEHYNTGAQEKAHEHKTVDDPPPAYECTAAEETVLKGLNDRCDRVQTHQSMDGDAHPAHAVGLAQRIDDRGRIHPK